MNTNKYTVNILVKNKPITEYNHTDNNIYIEGRPGSEYQIEFKNNTNTRVSIIPAVDGLSVMDGKPAGIESDGYIVEKFSSIVIPGWRLNNNQVAKFIFGGTKKSSHQGISYAEQITGSDENVGVIGIMVFEEYQQPKITRSFSWAGSSMDNNVYACTPSSSSGNHTLCQSSIQKNHNNIGTGFGQAMEFNTTEEMFIKKNPSQPDSIFIVYYDDIRGLERRGIDVKKKRNRDTPNAFPAYKVLQNSCKPPLGWTGNPEAKPPRKWC